MDWANLSILWLAAPIALALWWFHHRSLHPMGPGRRQALMVVRLLIIVLALIALAGPAWEQHSRRQAVLFVLDHSQSMGEQGVAEAHERARALAASLPGDAQVGFVSAGRSAQVRRLPGEGGEPLAPDLSLLETDGSATDLEAAVTLARGLFPPAASRRIVILSDGNETVGDLEAAAADAALADVVVDAAPVAGEPRPDVRIVNVRPSRSRLHEGANLAIRVDVESAIKGKGRVRLFENGIEVAARDVEMTEGEQKTIEFQRTPDQRNLYRYMAVVEGFEGDVIPENDQSMALVDVRGRPVVLYVEGEPAESHYLVDAMAREGIRLVVRPPDAMPDSLQELAGFDGVVFSDIPAHRLTDRTMTLVRDYVELLGGGFMMVGGRNSFGVGGYYRTPIEDILPIKMKAPDKEEKYSTALALVLDRSGSMGGAKIEICKSAAIACIELLSRKDYLGVVAFDSSARWIVPMSRVTSPAAMASQVSTLNAGGGTNIMPGMTAAREALAGVRAKVKHMIVLTDGQTGGGGYPQLAAQLLNEGVTVSTVGIGNGAANALLQQIASAGGGQFYFTTDPSNLPRIFTQDTMTHTGRLIREQDFIPRQVEMHPMIEGWPGDQAPPLLGYVKTYRKQTAQMPLVTDIGDPLLAHWRFGLGKVTAFTSDCKSRWSALWLAQWQDGYSQFWAQVLREMAREPQGQLMDIQIKPQGRQARVEVDLLEDASTFKDQANVEGELFFVPARSLGTSLQSIAKVRLDQEGPGRYAANFAPDEPGLYLVQARSGAEMVSAGWVRNVSGETATGRVNQPLLESVAQATGGTVLDADATALPALERPGRSHFLELAPWLLRAILVLFLIDIAIRRWENVRGLGEFAKSLAGGRTN